MPSQSIPSPQPAITGRFIEPQRETVLIRYLSDVFDWHGYVRFLSLAALRETSRDVPLEKLFVEPNVAAQPLSPDAMDLPRPPATQPLSAALAERPRLVLLGDPGSGKSTAINWICTALGRGVDDPLARQLEGHFVPLPLVLRELGLGSDFALLPDPGSQWEELLKLFLARPVAAQLRIEREKHGPINEALLGRMLESGQALVLLDGIDEIGSAEIRLALRAAVHEGMRRHPRCRWIMTSRIVGYEEVQFEDIFGLSEVGNSPGQERRIAESLAALGIDLPLPRGASPASFVAKADIRALADLATRELGKASPVPYRLYLAPFDDTQVEQFTRLWWAHHESNPHLAGTKPAQFLAALRQSHGALSLGRLPHLLTMIALVYRVRAELPDGRALLYNFIADAYLSTLDMDRGLEHLRRIPYDVQEMMQWLAAVGWHLQRRPSRHGDDGRATIVDRDELLDLLAGVVEVKPGDAPREVAQLFLEYAGRRSGLLLPRGQDAQGGDRYAFLHLSFQEYFAAQFLRNRVSDPDWLRLKEENHRDGTSLANLRRYANQPLWRETLIFLWESAALNNPLLPQRLLVRLLNWKRDHVHWGEFPVHTVVQAGICAGKPECQRIADMVALVAALSVNPHVTLAREVRQALWERCWRWELARQIWAATRPQHLLKKNDVARQLLSRPSYKAEISEVLKSALISQEPTALLLSGCTVLTELSALAGLSKLERLDLSGCTCLGDLSPLANLANVQWLDLSNCACLSSLSPLAGLAKLQWLDLTGCTGLNDLSPLAGLKNLRMLFLIGCTSLHPDQILNLGKALPRLHAIG